MPYYIFKVKPAPAPVNKMLEQVEEHEKFKSAKTAARQMRADNTDEPDAEFKVILAENALEAEEKLMEVREAPILAEWEK